MSHPQISDQQISAKQIQNLKSAEQVVDFFDMLGYPVADRIEMTPEALNLSDDLSESVQRIEKISSVDEMMEVYLVELLSLTVARRKALARAFRDFPMEFLFVLTDDYKQIDFMLLERKIPAHKDFGIGKRKALIHHHTFSVDRTNPDQVALRVLKRFSFTAFDQEGERDPLGQYDKLKSAFTTARWSEHYFNNRALFSDYYLTERVPEHSAWEAEDRHQVFRAIRSVYANAGSLTGKDHLSLQREIIIPVLEEIGFAVEEVESPEGPDLKLFPEENMPGEQVAFALCYPWNRYLDGRDAGGADPERGDENPGAVMVGMLEEGRASWGILTNGKIWRLYSAEAHSRATNYYEVDLEEALASTSPGKAFRYFYLFFRADAFIPERQSLAGETRELSFLDLLLEESDLYARQLGDRLKDTVFEEIFPYFAEGFIAGMGGAEVLLELPEEEREEKLRLVYRGTLTFLYRLLFLLYAESRDLLPVREVRGYYKKSLQRIKEIIAPEAGDIEELAPENIRKAFGKTETDLYERFTKLCGIVDEGSPAINVPVYNGGLFLTDPERARSQRDKEISSFLLEFPIPDQFFALGLDKMARDIDPKKHALGFIDYKSLGVRQLGSIYEGLLEFTVRLAAEKMAVVDGKKTEEIVAYREAKEEGLDILTEGRGQNAKERVVPRGEVYLVNDKSERKATGSYYTPDYIVKYIVEHAVGPVLDEKLEELQPRLQETEQKYRNLMKQKREVKAEDPDPYQLLKDNFSEAILNVFNIKVLDPAMGSGHFLVEAVDYITDRLVRFLDRYPFLSVFFEGMKETILNELSDQGVAAAPELLTDVNLLKRHVLKRCIYGVDLNPMAVELAKVSLWLDCFTLGAPLSFLDHHLKCGNSLFGVMARDLDENNDDDKQMTFLSGPFAGLLRAAEIMRGVSLLTDVTLDQVQKSGELYRKYEVNADPFKKLLDIYISQHFGVDLAGEFLTVHDQDEVLQMIKDETDYPGVYSGVVEKAQNSKKQKRLFHWDLEFPEVFIDLENTTWKSDGGFDAVIGNPPYIRQEIYKDKQFLKKKYDSYSGRADIYVYFLEKGIELLNVSGEMGVIVSNKFTQVDYGGPIKEFLTSKACPQIVLDFADLPVFKGVTTYPLVLIAKKIVPNESEVISYANVDTLENFPEALKLYSISVSDFKWREKFALESKDLLIFCVRMSEYSDQPVVGIKTGANDAYRYEEKIGDPETQEHIRPYIFGRNIGQYELKPPIPKIIFPYIKEEGEYRPKLPPDGTAIKEQLEINREDLENRAIIKEKYPKGQCEWFEFQQINKKINYKEPKIIYPNVSNQPSFALDESGSLVDMTAFIIPTDDKYLLSLLNSKLLFYIFSQDAVRRRGGYYEWKVQYIEKLPIRKINETTSKAERKALLDNLVDHYLNGEFNEIMQISKDLLPKNSEGEFLAFMDKATGGEEKSDVIRDFLSCLATNLIALYEEKKDAANLFWADIKRSLENEQYEVLKNKGKWEQTLARDPVCLPYVDPGSRSTKHLDESLGWDEEAFKAFAGMLIGKTRVTPALSKTYRKHSPKFKGLSNRIDETDDLIDQIVYCLYGLAEEEIEIVENSFKQ